MVRMIRALTLDPPLERIMSCQISAGRIPQRVKVGLEETLAAVNIAAEDLSIDIDAARTSPLCEHLHAAVSYTHLTLPTKA